MADPPNDEEPKMDPPEAPKVKPARMKSKFLAKRNRAASIKDLRSTLHQNPSSMFDVRVFSNDDLKTNTPESEPAPPTPAKTTKDAKPPKGTGKPKKAAAKGPGKGKQADAQKSPKRLSKAEKADDDPAEAAEKSPKRLSKAKSPAEEALEGAEEPAGKLPVDATVVETEKSSKPLGKKAAKPKAVGPTEGPEKSAKPSTKAAKTKAGKLDDAAEKSAKPGAKAPKAKAKAGAPTDGAPKSGKPTAKPDSGKSVKSAKPGKKGAKGRKESKEPEGPEATPLLELLPPTDEPGTRISFTELPDPPGSGSRGHHGILKLPSERQTSKEPEGKGRKRPSDAPPPTEVARPMRTSLVPPQEEEDAYAGYEGEEEGEESSHLVQPPPLRHRKKLRHLVCPSEEDEERDSFVSDSWDHHRAESKRGSRESRASAEMYLEGLGEEEEEGAEYLGEAEEDEGEERDLGVGDILDHFENAEEFAYFLRQTGSWKVLSRCIISLYDNKNRPLEPVQHFCDEMTSSIRRKALIEVTSNDIADLTQRLIDLEYEHVWLTNELEAEDEEEEDAGESAEPAEEAQNGTVTTGAGSTIV